MTRETVINLCWNGQNVISTSASHFDVDDFLDRHGGGDAFTRGAGQVLAMLPYRAGGAVDAEALTQLARAWLRANPA